MENKLEDQGILKMQVGDAPTKAVNAKTGFVEIGDRKIAYRSIGKGLPVILVNRFRGTLDTWDPAFLDALALKFNVIIIDYSGIGLSTGSVANDTLSMAKDVKDVTDTLKLTKIIIAGWSLGGLVAQAVTTQYPELVSHTIIIGAGPPGGNTSTTQKIFTQTALKPVYELEDEYNLFFEPKSEFSKNAAKLSHERISKRTEDLDIPVPMQYWSNQRKAIEDFHADKYDILGKLKRSKIPSLVFMGDHDLAFSVEEWYPLISKLQSTQFIVMPQAGHGPQNQYPDLAARYMANFIESEFLK
jgi:pimeloyl-ACP methyl ester carboxylesterase